MMSGIFLLCRTSSSVWRRHIAAVYPREAGSVMKVYGYNLVDIEKVYITDVTGEGIYIKECS